MKKRGKVWAGTVKGGDVNFVIKRRFLLRVPHPEPSVTFPDGREFPISRRALGKVLIRAHAHELAAALAVNIANPKRKHGEPVSIPSDLANYLWCLAWALPSSRRGRRRKASTNEALELAVEHGMRKAARLTAKSTGENPENIRARMYAAKRRDRKGGNKFK